LLDVVDGRSGTVLADWLADRDDDWKAAVAPVAGPVPLGVRVGVAHGPSPR
jgi:hypothetical protein